MRLLIVNPNISEDVTALIEKEALLSASPSTELDAALDQLQEGAP
jgi:allantoin racemase